jgi:hypothetical protein
MHSASVAPDVCCRTYSEVRTHIISTQLLWLFLCVLPCVWWSHAGNALGFCGSCVCCRTHSEVRTHIISTRLLWLLLCVLPYVRWTHAEKALRYWGTPPPLQRGERKRAGLIRAVGLVAGKLHWCCVQCIALWQNDWGMAGDKMTGEWQND